MFFTIAYTVKPAFNDPNGTQAFTAIARAADSTTDEEFRALATTELETYHKAWVTDPVVTIDSYVPVDPDTIGDRYIHTIS